MLKETNVNQEYYVQQNWLLTNKTLTFPNTQKPKQFINTRPSSSAKGSPLNQRMPDINMKAYKYIKLSSKDKYIDKYRSL